MTNLPTGPRGESRFFSNTVALLLQTVFAAVLTLAQVKILSNYLSQETFGLFVSLRGLSLLLSMIAANGLPQLLVRYLPALEAHGRRAAAMRLSIAAVLTAAAIAMALIAFVYIFRSWFLHYVPTATVDTDLLTWLFVLTLAVAVKMVVYGGLNGLRRLNVQVMFETGTLLVVLLWVIAARDTLSLTVLFQILAASHLASLVLLLPVFLIVVGRVDARDTPGPRESYRSYLLWASALGFVALAFTDVDRYLLAQVLSLELLALFHIAARVSGLANRFIGLPNVAFQPEITRLDAEGRGDNVGLITTTYIKFNTMIAIVTVVVVASFGREVIIAVSSRSYMTAVPVLVLLLAALPFKTVTGPLTAVMKARDQVRGALWTDLTWAGVYVLLILLLVPGTGLIGVGVATLAAAVAQLVAALSISNLNVGWRLVLALLTRLSVAVLCSFAPLLAAVFLAGPGWRAILLKAILLTAGLWVFQRVARRLKVLSPDEREVVVAMLEGRGIKFARVLI